MIDITAARFALGEIASRALPDVAVYPVAIDGTLALPAVVIGQPGWQLEDQPCMDRVTFPVAVLVARPGGRDVYDIGQLDGLWPVLVEALQDALVEDSTLGGVIKDGVVVRAGYTPFTVQNQAADYPAQVITVDLYG